MSEEAKRPEQDEAEVEAHRKVGWSANSEPAAEGDDDEVEAHLKRPSARED